MWTFQVSTFLALTLALNRALTVSAWPIGDQDEQDSAPTPTSYFGIIGLGFPNQCQEKFNLDLEMSTEFDKWASAAASTLMALIPTLLAFSAVKTSNIGLLTTLYTPLGCIAAAFTFGLPVTQTLIAEQAKTVLKAQDCLKVSTYLLPAQSQRQSPMAINDGVQSSEATSSSEDVDTTPTRSQVVIEQLAGPMSPSLLDGGLVSTIHKHTNQLEALIGSLVLIETQFTQVITELRKGPWKWAPLLASKLEAWLQPQGPTPSTVYQHGMLTKLIFSLVHVMNQLRKSPATVVLLLPSPDALPPRGGQFLLISVPS
ncbi:hypothetical protein BDZ91DRAFT_766670 [Kalaharituber pfeilii]|nr:hypothetical protein BDZ91DRAFT_766670 [Kalaharituber pfeilii]